MSGLAQVDGLGIEREGAGFDLRDVQQRVDDAEQMLAAVMDDARVVAPALLVEGPRQVAGQHVGEADDGVQRRAQLVADHRQEVRLGALATSASSFARFSSVSARMRSVTSKKMPSR